MAASGDGPTAARLLGSALRHREDTGLRRSEPDQVHLDRFIQPARASMGSADWQDAQSTGRDLSIEDALAEGLAVRVEQSQPTRSFVG